MESATETMADDVTYKSEPTPSFWQVIEFKIKWPKERD